MKQDLTPIKRLNGILAGVDHHRFNLRQQLIRDVGIQDRLTRIERPLREVFAELILRSSQIAQAQFDAIGSRFVFAGLGAFVASSDSHALLRETFCGDSHRHRWPLIR
jgi:hypothetical protein